ncbi:MAG: DUF4339 domain-containing protein [Akkermansiaceae bacterium]
MAENSQWYYTDNNGQQAGPVDLAQLRIIVQQSSIPADSLVWSEGMDDWKPISDVDGLASVPNPATPQLTSDTEPAPAQAANTANPYAPPQTQVTAPITDDDYPIPDIKRTNYGLMVATVVIGSGVFLYGFFQMYSNILEQTTEYSSDSAYSDPNYSGSSSDLFTTSSIVTTLVGFGILMFGVILALIYLHRAWRIIQPGGASTTPGKAVGFLFIPLFNFYWYFIAYWKWSQDWNRIASSHRKLSAAPRTAEGIFLAYAIVNVIGAFVSLAGLAAFVIFFIIMKQICDVVNYTHDLRASQPQQQRGGIQLH